MPPLSSIFPGTSEADAACLLHPVTAELRAQLMVSDFRRLPQGVWGHKKWVITARPLLWGTGACLILACAFSPRGQRA